MNFEQYCKPQTLNDLEFEDVTVRRTIFQLATRKMKSGCILFGPPGTGKSATAEVLAATLNACPNPVFDVPFTFEGYQLDDLSSLENTLNSLLNNVSFAGIVINEFDQMPKSSLNGLHAFWNTYNAHCGLILTTNNFFASSAALRSRLPALEIKCPSPKFLLPKVKTFLQQRGKQVNEHKILRVLNAANSDMRVCMRAIDQLAA